MIEILTKETDGFVFYSNGAVYSKYLERFLALSLGRRGYLTVHINNKTYSVHRIVALHFIPNPHKLPQINHIDGNKQNCNYWNLERCTASHNNFHAYRLRLNRGNFKLEDWKVKAIRLFSKYKMYKQKQLSKFYNVTQGTISHVVTGLSYKGV